MGIALSQTESAQRIKSENQPLSVHHCLAICDHRISPRSKVTQLSKKDAAMTPLNMIKKLFRDTAKSRQRSVAANCSLRHLSLESLEAKRLLAVTAPEVIIADDAPALTASLRSPGFRAVMVQPSGKILGAGTFEGSQGDDFTLVRYTAEGELDSTFGGDGIVQTNFSSGNPKRFNHDTAWGAAADSQGRIVVSGHDKSGNVIVARYDADGALDDTFSGDGFDKPGSSFQLDRIVHAIAFDAADDVYVAGEFNDEFRVAKYTSLGNLDTTFATGGVFALKVKDGLSNSGEQLKRVDIAIDSVGSVLLVGTVKEDVIGREVGVVRLTTEGVLDNTFDGDGIVTTKVAPDGENDNNYGNGIAIDEQGRILIAGISTHGMNVIRYEANGSLDTTFNASGAISGMPGVAVVVGPHDVPFLSVIRGRDLAVDDQGRIVIGGKFDQSANVNTPTTPAEQDAFVVARLIGGNGADAGTLDTTFGENGSGILQTVVGDGWNEMTNITIAPGGDIWASGHACATGGNCSTYGQSEPFDSVLLRYAAPNNTPGVTASPAAIQTSEDGGIAQFDVVLDTKPTGSVSVAITSDDTSEGVVVSGQTLVFDATNWDVPQTVIVQGEDDALLDGDQTYEVSVTPSSLSDPGYDGLPSTIVPATNLDDEMPPPSANVMYVWDIDFESRQRGRKNIDYQVVVDIRQDLDGVASENDANLGGVEVTVSFTGASGNAFQLTGQTDENGIFRSSWIKGLSSGTHRAEVVDLALSDFAWDPDDILDPVSGNDQDIDFDGDPDDVLFIA